MYIEEQVLVIFPFFAINYILNKIILNFTIKNFSYILYNSSSIFFEGAIVGKIKGNIKVKKFIICLHQKELHQKTRKSKG